MLISAETPLSIIFTSLIFERDVLSISILSLEGMGCIKFAACSFSLPTDF